MTLFLGPADVADLLTMEEAVAAVESGYRELAEHPVIGAPRARVHARSGVRVSVHPGGNDRLGFIGLMSHTELVRIEGGVQHVGRNAPHVYLLFDAADGSLAAIIAAELVGSELGYTSPNAFRPAAVSGVGVRHLARPDSRVAGILGSGGQARNHLLMLARLLPLAEARVFSPQREHRRDFAREMGALLGIDVRAVDAPQDAVRGADVVVAATNANQPALRGDWLEPGQHVISIVGSNRSLVQAGWLAQPRRELDDAVATRAELIVVNDRRSIVQDEQADLYEPLRRGLVQLEQLHELGEVVAGSAPRRGGPAQVTLHKNNVGSGVADISLAALAYSKALALGRGREL